MKCHYILQLIKDFFTIHVLVCFFYNVQVSTRTEKHCYGVCKYVLRGTGTILIENFQILSFQC
jgi:hypothetical protein